MLIKILEGWGVAEGKFIRFWWLCDHDSDAGFLDSGQGIF